MTVKSVTLWRCSIEGNVQPALSVEKRTLNDDDDHTYKELGHSQIEVDSVHSTIENAGHKKDVYAPTDYQPQPTI